MRYIIFLLLLVNTLFGLNCSDYGDFKEYNGHYYTKTVKKMTFYYAKTFAEKNNGYIAIPNNQDENDFIKNLLKGSQYGWIGIWDPNNIANYCKEQTPNSSKPTILSCEGNFPNSFIFSVYADHLCRCPDQAGYNYWLSQNINDPILLKQKMKEQRFNGDANTWHENCHYTFNCAYDDSRFKTIKGSYLSYKNFHAKQPDNLVKYYDYDNKNEQRITPLGENWVALSSIDGKWADFGNHFDEYNNPVKHYAIFEFENMPECYTPESNVTDKLENLTCNTALVWNGLGENTENNQTHNCLMDENGIQYCPADLEPCMPTTESNDGYSEEHNGNITANFNTTYSCPKGGSLGGVYTITSISGMNWDTGWKVNDYWSVGGSVASGFSERGGRVTQVSNGKPTQWNLSHEGGYNSKGGSSGYFKRNGSTVSGSLWWGAAWSGVICDKTCNDETYSCPIGSLSGSTCSYPAANKFIKSSVRSAYTIVKIAPGMKWGSGWKVNDYWSVGGYVAPGFYERGGRITAVSNGIPTQITLSHAGGYSPKGGSSGYFKRNGRTVSGSIWSGAVWEKVGSTYCSSGSKIYTIESISGMNWGSGWKVNDYWSVGGSVASGFSERGGRVTHVSGGKPTSWTLASAGGYNPKGGSSGYFKRNGSTVSGSLWWGAAWSEICATPYYTCPDGGSLSGSTCSYSAISINNYYDCPYLASSTTAYLCSNGTLSGSICSYKYFTYHCPSKLNYFGEPFIPNEAGGEDFTDSNPPADNCTAPTYTCKSNPEQVCTEIDNVWKCSEHPCVDGDDMIITDTQVGLNDKNNEGWGDDGSCNGQIYIFNGKDNRCRSDDLFFGLAGGGCCDKNKVFFGLVACKETEKKLAKLNNSDKCHYVGKYCSKKIKLGFTKICVQHKKTYCCFNSKLARIINEQGREQLSENWGIAESPKCKGFKPEEFQKLDMSQLDLTEFTDDIQTKMNKNVFNNLGDFVSDKVNNIVNPSN